MRPILTLIFIFFVRLVFAQSSRPSFFEVRVGYMPTAGSASIKGTDKPWINTLSSEGDNSVGDSFSNTNVGFTFGTYLSPKVRLGLGADVDFYYNISEGHSSRAVPFFGDFRYSFNENKAGFFVYAQAGYSFITGTDWHSGIKSGFGFGYSLLSRSGEHSFNFSIGYNRQILNKLSQQILGPPTNGVGYYGQTNVRYLSFAGYKNIIIQTLPIKIAYEF